MIPIRLPDRELVRQLLAYDPETGALTWLHRPREMFRTNRHYAVWNALYAGKIAGTMCNAYSTVSIMDVHYRAHRLIWLFVHGEPVPDIIDHIDRDPLNNRIANLRASTTSENRLNSDRWKTNPLGAKGVAPWRKKFRASIWCGGKHIYLGVFDTVSEAAEAHQNAAIRLRGREQRKVAI